MKQQLARQVVASDPEVRRLAEEIGLRAAATRLGMKYQTLYGRSKKQGWKIPDFRETRAKAKKAAEKLAESTGTSRRCESCYQLTRSDPCHQCGTKWKH